MPWLAVSMGVGVLFYLSLRVEPPAWAGPASLAVALLCCALARHRRMLRAAALCLAAGAAGFASVQHEAGTAPPVELLPNRAVILTGQVAGVTSLPEGRRVSLDDVRLAPDQPPLARGVRVRLKLGDPVDLAVGDIVRVRTLLRPPAPPAFPGGWDLQRDAFFAGLGGSGTALNLAERLERRAPSGLSAWFRAARDELNRRVTAGLPGPAGAVAAALMTGTQTAIPPATLDAFRDSGLAHLLSVSGLHIAIIMGLVMGAVRTGMALSERAALFLPVKAIAAVTGLAAGTLYMALTGVQVPILRSLAMADLVALALVTGRRALSLRGLAMAVIVILLVVPHELAGVSMQMSVSAVLALVAGYEALRPRLDALRGDATWWRRALASLAALVLTSLLAGSASAPFGAHHFGAAQLYFVVSNLVAVPLTTIMIMPAVLAAFVLMPFGLEGIAFAPLSWGIELLIWIGDVVARWPLAKLSVPHIPPWGLALFSLGFAWLALWRTRLRLTGIAAMALGLLSPAVAPPPTMLVSSEARLIAIRSDGFYLQSRSGASRFVLDAWQRYLAAGPPLPLRTEGAGVPCDADVCRVEMAGTLALLLRRDVRLPDCGTAVLLVSADPARDVCGAGTPFVDRFSVWRDGAHAIWITPAGPVVLSDRAHRGARPWVPPPPTPRRVQSALPAAPVDALPDDKDQ